MKSITLHSHVGSDGILKLQVPEDLKELDVTVTIQPVTGKKHPFDPEQWEVDLKALSERAEKVPVLPPEAFTRERGIRAYFRLTRDETAHEEIIRRDPNEKDKEMVRQFNEWSQQRHEKPSN